MAYNEKLTDRIRSALAGLPNVEEKKMFRGVTFMVDDKMCISVSGNELMLRLDPDARAAPELLVLLQDRIKKLFGIACGVRTQHQVGVRNQVVIEPDGRQAHAQTQE